VNGELRMVEELTICSSASLCAGAWTRHTMIETPTTRAGSFTNSIQLTEHCRRSYVESGERPRSDETEMDSQGGGRDLSGKR
jgi:hypothetical protein